MQELVQGFDQETAAVVMARLCSHKMEMEVFLFVLGSVNCFFGSQFEDLYLIVCNYVSWHPAYKKGA